MVVFQVTYDWKRLLLRKGEWNAMLRAAYAEGAGHWHEKFADRHFTAQGARVYHYEPRGRGYEKRKLREKGHNNPLVWSGASRTLAGIRDIRSTFRSGRAVIHARGLNRKPRGKKDSMREEMTRVTENERRSMVATVRRALDEAIARDNVRFREDLS